MLPIAPSLEALLGEPVEQMVELGSPWATSTQTELATLARGRQVVVQRPRGDASAQLTIRRRLRLGRLLPTVAPWLPVPDVLAGVAAGPQPFLVTRFIPGVSGRELLADDRGAERLGGLMGELATRLARVPTRGMRLGNRWGDPNGLAAAARRWLDTSSAELGADGARALDRRLRRVPRDLAGEAPVFAHGDFAPVNVVLRDGKVVALLDFERARIAHPLFDAAWWRWILRHHHPERWAAAWPAFRATAGLDDSPETTARLDLLAALQCLEMVHGSRARPAATRREWVARLLRVLGWEDDDPGT